jgi:hypothetical protein
MISIDGQGENIKSYEYKGEDHSISYQKIISPLCDKILEYIPIWFSPNILSLIGLLINSLNFFLLICFTGLKGNEENEFYVKLINLFLNFIYLIIQKCVIKQAIRTKSLTTLVLLINHSIGAISLILISINFGSIIAFDELNQYIFLYISFANVFYFNKWEEYINGELILPKCNGICDGIILICLIDLFTCFSGSEFWNNSILNRRYNDSLILISCIYGFYLCYISFQNVKTKNPKKISSSFNFFTYYIYILITLFLIVKLNNSNIIDYYPKVLVVTYGLSISQLIGEMHISHLKQIEFKPNILFILPPLIYLPFHSIITHFMKKDFFFSIDIILLSALSWNLIVYSHWIYTESIYLSDTLFIYIFSLEERKEIIRDPRINIIVENYKKQTLI